jgi:hypothetical protein
MPPLSGCTEIDARSLIGYTIPDAHELFATPARGSAPGGCTCRAMTEVPYLLALTRSCPHT